MSALLLNYFSFEHPKTGKLIECSAALPSEMQGLIEVLAQDASLDAKQTAQSSRTKRT